ncbi:hypothetical protein D5086_025706 [Populus alba]|uniref:Uncharacterized protein n=2 Tax=Populus TaxID=3689 RepID=A0ACC4B0D1_POPAL|nr:hypothetical protein NC653_032535 [Populus alba x Populus x berolinensis]
MNKKHTMSSGAHRIALLFLLLLFRILNVNRGQRDQLDRKPEQKDEQTKLVIALPDRVYSYRKLTDVDIRLIK